MRGPPERPAEISAGVLSRNVSLLENPYARLSALKCRWLAQRCPSELCSGPAQLLSMFSFFVFVKLFEFTNFFLIHDFFIPWTFSFSWFFLKHFQHFSKMMISFLKREHFMKFKNQTLPDKIRKHKHLLKFVNNFGNWKLFFEPHEKM